MIRFEDLVEKVRASNPEADIELLRRAYVFSAFEHKGQVRHSGEPYLVHPLEVADLLADMKLDVVAIAAGLLHDIVEDTQTPIERIRELFGTDVAHVVEGVTKLGAIPFSSSEERQAENFRKMLLAMVDDIRVILVKLADRLHNMRTLHHLPEERRIKIAQETRDIYAPIANRLGMSKVKNELEELAFKYLEPKAYESLRQRVESAPPRHRRDDRGAAEDHHRQARRGAGAGHPDRRADQAPVQHPPEAEAPEDRPRAGLRPGRAADHHRRRCATATPRSASSTRRGRRCPGASRTSSRCRGRTATSRCTRRSSASAAFPSRCRSASAEMHRIAEEGIAAHWKYKEGRVGADRDEQYFLWLRQLLEWQQEVRDPQEFLQNLKIDLYPEEVYIFTPKGEVKALPRDATPVDFAYAIHTDVGHQCVGARVNGKMVPLRTRLRNGDIVEIVTTPGHKPSRDWLNFVTTSRARNKIKHFIHAEEKIRSLELGRKLFDKEARRFGLNVKKLTESERFAELLSESGFQKADELFAAIGYGKLRGQGGAGQAGAAGAAEGAAAGERAGLGRAPRARHGRGEDQGPRHRRHDGLPRALLQSDPRREDRRLHHARQGRLGPLLGLSRTCSTCSTIPNGASTSSGTRAPTRSPYTVRLSIQVEDRKGILADVSSKIAGINTNIRNVEATTTDQMGRIDMTVEISDVKHLQKVIKSLRSVEGVLDVERARTDARQRIQLQAKHQAVQDFGCAWLGIELGISPSLEPTAAMTSISTRASWAGARPGSSSAPAPAS